MKSLKKHSLSFVVFLLVFSIAVSPVASAASWDGTGLPAGGNSNTTHGTYGLSYDNENAIYGYRFSLYDASGKKLSYSIDMYFKNPSDRSYTSLLRNRNTHSDPKKEGTIKKSHTEYYKEYTDNGTTSVLNLTAGSDAGYEFYDSSLPQTPSKLEAWLTPPMARKIAERMNVYEYDSTSTFMVAEPMFVATLDGSKYSMTIAEYAVYQATQYGWTSYPNTFTADTYGNLAHYLGGIFGLFLYAEGSYSAFPTKPIPDSAFKTNKNGDNSILFGSNTLYNTPANILKYQMGMGVYSNTIPLYNSQINHWAFGFKNGEGTNAAKNAFHLASSKSSYTANSQYVLNASKATTIPNGFTLRNSL